MKCCSSYSLISSYLSFPLSVRSIRSGLKSFPMKLEICSCFSQFDCVRLSLKLVPFPFSIFQLVILRIGIILDLLLILLQHCLGIGIEARHANRTDPFIQLTLSNYMNGTVYYCVVFHLTTSGIYFPDEV